MNLMFYKVTPLSVLFFRDTRPFLAGEQSLARLNFPPGISPFLGALRTKYLEIKSSKEKKSISQLFREGVAGELENISIFWFSFFKDENPILPMPCDAFSSWKRLSVEKFVFENEIRENTLVPIKKEKQISKKETSYLSLKGFLQYTRGLRPSSEEIIPASELYQIENRVGLTLTKDTKTSERSKFYRMSVARLKKGVGFLVGVEMEDNVLPEKFTTRLGGEGHIAIWEMIESTTVSKSSARFDGLVALTLIPIKKDRDGQYEIKNWCVNKLDAISGWDYKENRAKPLVKALKPGSVLLVKPINEPNPEVYKIKFNNENTTEVIKNLSLSVNHGKPKLSKFHPQLNEPEALLVVKKQ
ncbi:MAG: type III-B CRISPR module-associated Cmr3 family protein [Desulfonauticus sp.]|nr:type III-B CRISPR module-associated Cmr3 family protein [Desulfonauticus sp.]